MNNPITNYTNQLKNEFAGYNKLSIQKDLMAGITVAAVALPLALAFGVSSGADAAAGLITAIVAAIVIGGLSGASYQISGPTGAMSVILVPLAIKYGMTMVLIAGLMAGVLLIVAGLMKLGKLVYFLPSPVVAGFTSGIALIIVLGQIDNFFGVKSEGENAIQKIKYLIQNGFDPNFYAIAIALFVIVLMIVWPKKWNAKVPASLVGIIVVTIVNLVVKIPIVTVGKIPQTLLHNNRVHFEDFASAPWQELLVPAVSIAALCMIESLLCGVAGGNMKGEQMDGDQELIAQGIGNILLPFLGGVPATAAIARTSVAIKSGQKTRLTGIIQGVVLLLSMFIFSPFMSEIPLSALAGVLIVTAWRMNEWANIKYIFGRKLHWAAGKFLITMIATVVFDLTIAIAAGVIFSLLYFIMRISDIDIEVSKVDPDRMDQEISVSNDVDVMYITGPIFFGSLNNLMKRIEEHAAGTLILSMRGVPHVDTSGAQALLEFYEKNHEKGNIILFASMQDDVKRMFKKAGLTETAGEKAFFSTAKDAIEYLHERQA